MPFLCYRIQQHMLYLLLKSHILCIYFRLSFFSLPLFSFIEECNGIAKHRKNVLIAKNFIKKFFFFFFFFFFLYSAWPSLKHHRTGFERLVLKLFSYSTQLIMKLILLTNVKLLTSAVTNVKKLTSHHDAQPKVNTIKTVFSSKTLKTGSQWNCSTYDQ